MFTLTWARSGSLTGSVRSRNGSSGYCPALSRGRSRLSKEHCPSLSSSIGVETFGMMGGALVMVYMRLFSSENV